METYVLKREKELCSRLGMDFDEANELFGRETLSGMQMVQVNGGFVITLSGVAAGLAIAAAIVTIIAGSIAIYEYCTSTDATKSATLKPGSNNNVIVDYDGKTCHADTAYHYLKDGSVIKYINYTGPSPYGNTPQ